MYICTNHHVIMEKRITYQKLGASFQDKYALAQRYYELLFCLNAFNATEREIELIAFTAVKGNISFANVKEEFCKKHNTTLATVNNMISRLKKIGILVKDGEKVKVIPNIVLNFDNDVVLQIKMEHGKVSD